MPVKYAFMLRKYTIYCMINIRIAQLAETF